MGSVKSVGRAMTMAEWAMLVTLSVVWGGSFFFNALALRELPVFTVVFARVALAALLFLAILAIRGDRLPREARVWAAFLGLGLLNNVIPFLLIVGGQRHVASGVASILNATTPLFTVIFAHLLTRDEKLSPGKLFGVILGFGGVAVMIGGDALRTLGVNVAAQTMCLGAAFSYGFANVFARRFQAMGLAPMMTATGQAIVSSLVLLPLVLVLDRPWALSPPGPVTIGAVLGLAAISTVFAYLLFFRILATAGATNLALTTFLIPVSAILLGALFLGEVLMPQHFAGMALIGLGLAAIDGRVLRILSRPEPRAGGETD